MPVTPTDLREIHGSVYVTETPDGLIVPWNPLSIGDFLEYDNLFRNSVVDRSILENEIFSKCVTDPAIKANIQLQKAGTISLVVQTIMSNSGPNSIDEMNMAMDYYRVIAQQPLHQLVSIICRAFPGYTPDDIYKMDFHKMTMRLAQAESKLISLGLMTEPLEILDPEKENKQPEKPRPKVDPQKLKEAFDLQDPKQKKVNRSKAIEQEEIQMKPDLDKNGKKIISADQMRERFAMVDDGTDLPIIEHQMIKDARKIYGDYLKQGNKVEIKSEDQRIEDAKKRIDANRQKNLEAAKQRRKK